jgi:hypothetical protein
MVLEIIYQVYAIEIINRTDIIAMAASIIKLKLLIDTKAKKVILVEAGKDFIDSVTLFKKSKTKEVGAVEQVNVDLGKEEVCLSCIIFCLLSSTSVF